VIGWPEQLWLVRHGESEGNLANVRAHEQGADRLDISVNDVDVALSPHGERQAQALGGWLRDAPAQDRPTVALTSPYRRARQTLEQLLDAAALTDLPTIVDERLRDREQGWLDRFTGRGVRAEFPDESERRDYLGKFWYRPPGGESWADVALRLRSLVTDLRVDHAGARVLLVTHDVPIILTRYILEALTTDEAVGLSRQVRNCSLTSYDGGPGPLRLRRFNDVTAVEAAEETAVTTHE
jgi:broad specificity phosphatase PhoE